MKLFSQKLCPRGLAVVCALAGAGLFTAARADEWNKRTTLTVNEPVQVANKVLDPGSYVFKLVNSSSDRNIVQIFDANQNHLIETVMAVPAYRVQPTGSTRLTYWETPPGTARAVRAWYYPGDYYGQEFPYPAHPAVLQASAKTTNAPPPPSTAATGNNNGVNNNAVNNDNSAAATAQAAQAAPPPEPAGEQSADRSAPEQTNELAQNNPPPSPAPAAQPEPQQNSNEQPQNELPKTASPFPLYGLGGMSLIGLSMLLRRKRVS
jgi:LPXTG-motif cell wall-anchored protein